MLDELAKIREDALKRLENIKSEEELSELLSDETPLSGFEEELLFEEVLSVGLEDVTDEPCEDCDG